eukprot:TRINITY_DN1693_c3_g1_i1.p1 TRINITY_DN1693_c3_g1~~TRINITY_DN1693_c3_g1_i1.p1  ORF type:complete len:394 (-),score=100.08 TRINITY_DN1693_c3_g1_i1:116-1297(-)
MMDVESINIESNNNINSSNDEINLIDKYFNVLKYSQLPNHKIIINSFDFNEPISKNYNDNSIAAKIGSSYPLMNPKDNTNDRLGDPICDSFNIVMNESIKIVTLSDGCSWGKKPYEASNKATNSTIEYLLSKIKQKEILNTQELGQKVYRSMCRAHESIIEGKGLWESGTATLLVSLLVELDNSPMKYGLMCGNVGDCRCYHFSVKENAINEVTQNVRENEVNLNDPGGRIGQHVGKFGFPDLRNLRLFFAYCEKGDIIMMFSDGVYDNFDARIQGKSPSDLGLDYKEWDDVPKELLSKTTTKFQHEQIRSILFDKDPLNYESWKNKDDKEELLQQQEVPSPKLISERFLDFSLKITSKSRDYMENNPKGKQPNISLEYPGKMDHISCVVYLV